MEGRRLQPLPAGHRRARGQPGAAGVGEGVGEGVGKVCKGVKSVWEGKQALSSKACHAAELLRKAVVARRTGKLQCT